MKTILITGATGTTGAATLQHLKGKGFNLRAMTRSAEKAAALEKQGVSAVVADYGDAASLSRALEGAGEQQAADAVYREVAKQRSYYGFLAADRIGEDYHLHHADTPVTTAMIVRRSIRSEARPIGKSVTTVPMIEAVMKSAEPDALSPSDVA